MMIRGIVFILVLFFIAGCGMSGSNSKDDSKDDSTVATTENVELNVTDDSTLIAVVEIEEPILPQTFSISFPSILKKEFADENNQISDSNTTTPENNQTSESNITTPENNQINESNITTPENNQINESNITTPENNETSESNITTPENNQTVVYCDSSDGNKTLENNQTEREEDNIAYNSLKDKIEKIERVVKISQINLTSLEGAMPQVLDNCEGMDFNDTCIFEENRLSVVMDNETIAQISSMIEENNITFPDINDSGVSLGEVIYIKYSDDTLYQYGLTHEMSVKELNSSKREQYIFKWSESSKDILTQYNYEDNETLSKVSIHYLSGEDNKELMHVAFVKNSLLLGKKERMNLTLVKTGDENGTYTINSDSIEEFKDGNETNVSRFSSNGDISDDSSLLLFSGSVSNENNSTKNEITTTLENSRVVCDPSNIGELNIELYELNITGGELEDAQYLIFPPDIVVAELSSLEIYEQSIGSFTVEGDKIQGAIHGDSYEDILDSLIILRLIESQEFTEMFKIVENGDKPNLKIVKY